MSNWWWNISNDFLKPWEIEQRKINERRALARAKLDAIAEARRNTPEAKAKREHRNSLQRRYFARHHSEIQKRKKDRYRQLKEEGKCVNCMRFIGGVSTYCVECKKQERDRHHKHYFLRKVNGLCVRCGTDLHRKTMDDWLEQEDRPRCDKCRNEATECIKKLREERIKKGQCTRCKRMARPNRRTCQVCTDKRKAHDRASYLRRTNQTDLPDSAN